MNIGTTIALLWSSFVISVVIFVEASEPTGNVAMHTSQDRPTQISINGNLTEWDQAAAEFIEYGFYLDSITADENDIQYGLAFFDMVAASGTPCAIDAMETCGKGRVCWICNCWDGNGGGHCSYGCDTGSGCQPAPPCGCLPIVR